MIYTNPEDNIREEKSKYTKWFEDILNVNGIKFKKNITQDWCDGFTTRELTRKILYFDTLNKVICTHSPYGTHWENAKHIVKLTANDNFRWYIEEDVFDSTSNVFYQEYGKAPKIIFTVSPFSNFFEFNYL